jgi:hypothetical protein
MIPVRSRPTSTADLPSAPISALLSTTNRHEKRQRSGSPESLRPAYGPSHPYRPGPANGEHQILRLPSFNSVRCQRRDRAVWNPGD